MPLLKPRNAVTLVASLGLMTSALAAEPEWTEIPEGTFMMGAPDDETARLRDEILHEVTLTHSFEMQTTEVTQAQWTALMGDNPSSEPECGEDCPVDMVSWNQAAAYMNALSKANGLEACYVIKGSTVTWPEGYDCEGYRLPTEAEWEYAVRAGSGATRYGEPIEDISWYKKNTNTIQPVGGLTPNDWKLYDMYGNVWEWVWDRYSQYSETPVTDPMGPVSGGKHIRRGGSCVNYPRQNRAAFRLKHGRTGNLKRQGLRPVRTIPPAE